MYHELTDEIPDIKGKFTRIKVIRNAFNFPVIRCVDYVLYTRKQLIVSLRIKKKVVPKNSTLKYLSQAAKTLP